MSIQQMMMGASFVLVTITGDPIASEFRTEPAPGSLSLNTNSVTVSVVGNVGTPTYAWARVSGDTTFGPNSTTAATVFWTATVLKNNFKTALWRCTVTVDGQVFTVDAEPYLEYMTDL